ncbi:MAG: hypothetical protein NWF01_09190 [Candidatus Bathyarchaeota archaeon]|nr:hypothetical protein [Candidatus Bathyarchaeota archaeon]
MGKPYRRGYAVAVLLGIEQNSAATWKIFSNVAKPDKIITLTGERKDQKALYNFHETLINALRPSIKEGTKSIVIAAPSKTSFAQDFLGHARSHHSWLFSGEGKATFSQITGSAVTPPQVAAITRTAQFKELIEQTTITETENLQSIIERRLGTMDNYVLFSLQEAENAIFNPQTVGKPSPEYLLLTNNYLKGSRQKNRVHRLMQIAQNKQIKTRVVNEDSAAGARINQLGGIICLLK